ncbi:NACHT domain-containing protein [Streptomyces sp. NBC_01343]|uniref:NACHT domain-containing protein n=1 Tax=Streptomyces sp. NBC_01343 TaxID=2903832 RepID=UPI002E0E191D|nr:NACHT domain-containing protein [Streptomyces sp. NBC_01343]
MDASTVGIRLASGIATPLIKRLFRGEGAGADLVDRPVRISSYVSLREKRVLDAADLRRLAEGLLDEASATSGERRIPPGEEAGVATALAATLHALGDVTLSDLEAVRLGPRAFARELRSAAPDPLLSRDAALFHEDLLEATCLHILNFFTQRSTFIPATLVQQTRDIAELIAKIDELLNRIRRQDARDPEFERRYLDYIVRRHGTLTIFGLDLAPGSARWPLDVAYIGLAAENGRTGVLPGPADEVLNRHERVLLRGEAGSGKTTLIQWLAVSAARGEQAGRIPYVLPLRTLTRHGERLPPPARFLAAVGSPLTGEQPQGWEGRVLRDGRALVLVDGLDEIPEAERPQAHRWLEDLLAAYPGNRWLVTSRPAAVRGDWLTDQDFEELQLAPMSRAEVAAFVERWHTAAEGEAEELDLLRERLLHSVHSKPELARLATNPLLCGLFCALHRERRGFLPSGRKELYTAALSMLLHRRDRERGLRLPELAEEPQLQLLQRLAYWLIRNGRAELGRGRAEALIADALPAVPAARVLGDAPAVLRHFLERTGLLRAPTEDTVEFVHRTFQDFLGAGAALDEGGLGELTRHADDDQWEDVIRMAVAQGRPRDRAAIIRDLLIRGSDRSELLAFACLEFATELEPELREDVQAAAGRLIPPATDEAAQALARVGPLVLELLPGPELVGDAAKALHTITAAGRVGSDQAIPFLARYVGHSSAAVRMELARLWSRFEARPYAEQVIARLPAEDPLTVLSDEALDALGSCSPRRRLTVAGPVTPGALARYLARVHPERLTLRDNPSLTDLRFLRGQDSLSALVLQRCPKITDVDALAGLPVRAALLDLSAPAVRLGGVLSGWDRLAELEVRGDLSWSLEDVAQGASLTHLDARSRPRPAHGLRGLSRHGRMRTLMLGAEWGPATAADWRELGALPELRILVLEGGALDEMPEDLRLSSVEELELAHVSGDPKRFLRRLPALLPGLRLLSVLRSWEHADVIADGLRTGPVQLGWR